MSDFVAASASLSHENVDRCRLSRLAMLCSATGLSFSLLRLFGMPLHLAGMPNASGALGTYAQATFALASAALLIQLISRKPAALVAVRCIAVLLVALCATANAEMLIARVTVAAVGSAIFLLTLPEQLYKRAAQYIALGVSGMATIVMLKYGYGLALIPAQFGVPSLFGALQMNCCALAIFFADMNTGPASVFAASGIGGSVARRVLLPLALLIPALGVLSGEGQKFELDLTIIAIAANVLLPLLLWFIAAKLNERDHALANEKLQVERLRLSEEKLRTALEAKTRFLANISHELRTPLATVIGATELTLLAPLSEEQRQLTNSAHQSACSLLEIVNDLLDISRLESQHLQLHRSVFEIEPVITAVVAALNAKATAKNLQLESSISQSVPASIASDPERLAQILFNLVDNAIKFSDRGTVRIFVELEQASSLLKFSVADEGIGIDDRQRSLVFSPFTKVDESLSREHGGIGLGLAICKGLVQLMGGDIGVDCAAGGSTFWFRIPVEAAVSRPMPSVSTEQTSPRTSQDKLLIVEDNAINAKIIALQLKRLGYQTDVVSNGKAAIDAMSSGSYALVLMDVQMPVMNGIEATKAIRNLDSPLSRFTPVVALTAHATPEDRLECLKCGMNDYLSKPVSLEKLHETVRRWVPPRSQTTSGSVVPLENKAKPGS